MLDILGLRQQAHDAVAIEFQPGLLAQEGEGFGVGPGLFVRPLAGQGIEHVGHGDNP